MAGNFFTKFTLATATALSLAVVTVEDVSAAQGTNLSEAKTTGFITHKSQFVSTTTSSIPLLTLLGVSWLISERIKYIYHFNPYEKSDDE